MAFAEDVGAGVYRRIADGERPRNDVELQRGGVPPGSLLPVPRTEAQQDRLRPRLLVDAKRFDRNVFDVEAVERPLTASVLLSGKPRERACSKM